MKSVLAYIRHKPSVISIILICLTITEVHLNLVRYQSKSVIIWDAIGYYCYLPATIIKKDVKLSFINDQNKQEYDGIKYVYVNDKNGNHIIKYSMGMAVLYAPFFLVAHALAGPLGYNPNGYSEIYHFFIEFSGLFYLLFGLIYLRKLLLMYYSETITAISIFVMTFGTNLLSYTTVDCVMSHSYTLSLFSIFLYCIVKYYQIPKTKYIIALAILLGLIILIRPLNSLLAIAIVFIGINNKQELKNRFLFFIKHYKQAILFVCLTFLVVSPQLLYWKYVTGHYLVFSYGKEGFFFGHPHILDCLFSFRKGWLIYSPLFLFVFPGLYFIRKQSAKGFYSLHVILLPLYLYIVASWWCWWYGGSFGLRPMIDLYPLLVFPLAAFFYRISTLKKTNTRIWFGIISLLVALNIYQTFQYKYRIIHYDAMTFKAYVNAFGKMDKKYIDNSLLRDPDYEKAILGLDE